LDTLDDATNSTEAPDAETDGVIQMLSVFDADDNAGGVFIL
jgi:hypothetical protein